MAQVRFRMLQFKSSEGLQGYLVLPARKARTLYRALLQFGFSLQELPHLQAANHTPPYAHAVLQIYMGKSRQELYN